MRRAALLALAMAAFAAIASVPSASADVTLCQGVGSGAGQCKEPRGVATDFETERVYVAERGNNRVSVFEADGGFLFAFGWGVDTGAATLEKCTTASGCQAGIEGAGAGQFAKPTRIAVDNVEGSSSRHAIYVGTDNFRVQKFKPDGGFELSFGTQGAGECQISSAGFSNPLTVGPGGNVFVADSSGSEPNFTDRVEKFSPAGACLGETVLLKGNFRITSLEVDGSEDAFIAVDRLGGLELRKYDLGTPETKLCDLDPGIETRALALDSTGRLFASQVEVRAKGSGAFQVITEYDVSSCPPAKHVRRFGYGEIEENVAGLAALHTTGGDVFASEAVFTPADESGDLIPYLSIPDPGPIVAPESIEASPIGNVKATVKAEVNPEGKATSYHFEYLTEAEYEANPPAERFAGAKASPPKALSIPAGKEFRVLAAEAVLGCPTASKQLIEEGKCLKPETEYRFRVVATNADNPTGKEEGTVEGTPFTTKDPIEIGDVYATEVGTDYATINAEVNPLGIPAVGWFEYVTEARFQESGFAEAIKVPDVDAEAAPLDFGAAEVAAKRSVSLAALDPGSTYRYRLIAANPFLAEPIASEARSFTTFTPQAPSPGSCPGNEAFRTASAALLPDCRAYEMVSPLDKASGDVAVLEQFTTLLPAVLSQSAVSGGRFTYGSYRAFGDAKSAPTTSQYLAVRNPLGNPEEGWRSKGITPAYGESIIGAADFDYEFKAFSDDLCESLLVPLFEPPLSEAAIPGYKNLYRGNLCGEGGTYEALSTAKPQSVKRTGYLLEVQGVSADRSVVAFASNDSLEGTEAPPQPPGCAIEAQNCQSRLYLKGPEGGPRYACILPGGLPSNSPCTAGATSFSSALSLMRSANVQNALSEDGKRLWWTKGSGGGGLALEGPIYLRSNPLAEGPECAEAASPCTIAVSAEAEEDTGKPSHFLAASSDGSTAIFSSGDGLFEFDVAGKTTTPIAAGFKGVLGVSEDASRVYFASTEALAGGAVAGKANLYLREADGGTRFIATLADADVVPAPLRGLSSATAFEPELHNGRVSPDGEQAAFMSTAPLTGYDNADATSGKADAEVFLYDATANGGAGELLCVSCNPSGARPVGIDIGTAKTPFPIAARLPVPQNTLYYGRLLSEDGSRLYFESQDSLVARDTNGRIDVYQWERAGTGGCDEADVGFISSAGGCVEPISSGKSKSDSTFLDADPSGDNVFFTTLEGLLPEDYGLIDVYDARVGGGFPSPPPKGPECEGESCRRPPPAPEFRTPASAGTGPGNLPAQSRPSRRRCPKGKSRVGRGAKSRCVSKRRAKRKAARHKRAGNERRARR